jgi:hypothetical protein
LKNVRFFAAVATTNFTLRKGAGFVLMEDRNMTRKNADVKSAPRPKRPPYMRGGFEFTVR